MGKTFLSFLLLLTLQISAQRYIWSPDSISLADPNYAMNKYHDILRYHDPIMYLVFPVVEPIKERSEPLKDGEGKNGYYAEGNFAYRFAALQGKYYSPSFLQPMRLTFDVGLTLRVARDNSAPLLPMNNMFGLGLDFLFSRLKKLAKKKSTLVWTTIQLHHFSNGQSDSFFTKNSTQRNNYRNGDFSTNHYRIMLNISHNAEQKSIVTGTIGYQKEIDLGGPFARSKELYHYYGKNRLLMSFQVARKPKLAAVNINRATDGMQTIKVEKRRQLTYRTELEYISGNLSNFPGDNKYRFGWHNYLNYMPSVTNEIGFILHSYVGRDYLNIRFDDPVFIIAGGLYIKFDGK